MKEEYFKRIETILDEAASDRKGMSTEVYIEFLEEVMDCAKGRRSASESDLENQEADGD